MAANEHKNLSSANRHNPKGFESASNDTILSKGLGTPGFNDGNLEWVAKSNIKTRKVSFSGYCSLLLNYSYPEPQSYGQSPYDINQDYGSATLSALTTVSQKKFFRIGQFCSEQAGVINGGTLQVSCPNAEGFTVALVQYSPSDASTTAYPLPLIEKSVVGLSSDNLVKTYSLASADFGETNIVLGNQVFLMVKANGETVAPTVYINLSVEIGYSK
tara:strand:- start:277 stop:924 length:648 start_codon:yes stop_codon:yes gene_type:complete